MKNTKALTLWLSLLSGSAMAGPFTNGSFEVGASGSIMSLGVGSTALTGWVVIYGGIEAATAAYYPPADGTYLLDLNGVHSPGGVRQTFDTIPGHTYQVTFALAGNPDWGPDYLMRVSAAAYTADYPSVATKIWTNQAFAFTATSNTTTLSFWDVTPGGSGMKGGPSLDNVRISDPPTFIGITPQTSGGVSFTANLTPGPNYTIQTATDLTIRPVPWLDLTNIMPTNAVVTFTNSMPLGNSVRFYRVVH